MVLRFVAVVLCLLSLIIVSAASLVNAGGPPVYVPPSCAPAPVSCAPQPCPPPSCGPSNTGLLGGLPCLNICTSICGAVISCPAFIMHCLLAPTPAPLGLPWGSSPRTCGPPPCAPAPCAPPVCLPPTCAPAPITKCKPVSYQAPCGVPACPPPVCAPPQCGPGPQSSSFGIFGLGY
jgi:hypothetical protein